MIADPYPPDLSVIDEIETRPADPMIAALNRLAQAIEQNTLAILDNGSKPVQNAPQRPAAPLAALPPVQTRVETVASVPPCPYHGTEKVRSSTNGKGGFYCASKAMPGQPSNPKGYCTWHS